MDRRRLLASLGSVLALPGCSAFENRTDTPDSADDIFLVLHNETSTAVDVDVTVTFLDSEYFEAERRVDPDAVENVYPEIHWPGEYVVTVAVDDREELTVRFDVEGFDLRQGSNFVVWIGPDAVRFGIEE